MNVPSKYAEICRTDPERKRADPAVRPGRATDVDCCSKTKIRVNEDFKRLIVGTCFVHLRAVEKLWAGDLGSGCFSCLSANAPKENEALRACEESQRRKKKKQKTSFSQWGVSLH